MANSQKTKTTETENKIIRVRNLKKSFVVGQQKNEVLKSINFDISEADFMVIFGPSGCGKSTLLYTLLGLEKPDEGEINILGEDIYRGASEDSLADFRIKHFGMVYQQSNWVSSMSVLENVAFPLLLLGCDADESLEKAQRTLKIVGMTDWSNHRPAELSGGQQQKVAVARALVTDPEIIIADEPTGNLDYQSGMNVINLLNDLRHIGKTIIMVTHDINYISHCKTVVRIFNGEVKGIYGEFDKSQLMQEIIREYSLSFCAPIGWVQDKKEK